MQFDCINTPTIKATATTSLNKLRLKNPTYFCIHEKKYTWWCIQKAGTFDIHMIVKINVTLCIQHQHTQHVKIGMGKKTRKVFLKSKKKPLYEETHLSEAKNLFNDATGEIENLKHLKQFCFSFVRISIWLWWITDWLRFICGLIHQRESGNFECIIASRERLQHLPLHSFYDFLLLLFIILAYAKIIISDSFSCVNKWFNRRGLCSRYPNSQRRQQSVWEFAGCCHLSSSLPFFFLCTAYDALVYKAVAQCWGNKFTFTPFILFPHLFFAASVSFRRGIRLQIARRFCFFRSFVRFVGVYRITISA